MYKLLVENSAKKDLNRINVKELKRIAVQINQLKEEPRLKGVSKLKGSENDWRIRIGDYRIIYEINDNLRTVTILRVKHRKDAYK